MAEASVLISAERAANRENKILDDRAKDLKTMEDQKKKEKIAQQLVNNKGNNKGGNRGGNKGSSVGGRGQNQGAATTEGIHATAPSLFAAGSPVKALRSGQLSSPKKKNKSRYEELNQRVQHQQQALVEAQEALERLKTGRWPFLCMLVSLRLIPAPGFLRLMCVVLFFFLPPKTEHEQMSKKLRTSKNVTGELLMCVEYYRTKSIKYHEMLYPPPLEDGRSTRSIGQVRLNQLKRELARVTNMPKRTQKIVSDVLHEGVPQTHYRQDFEMALMREISKVAEYEGVLNVQRLFRGYSARKQLAYEQLIRSVVFVQSRYRGYQTRKKLIWEV